MIENLKNYKIFLASQSPRRKELLTQLRIPFNIVNIRGIDETYPTDIETDDIPEYLAIRKAEVYSRNFHSNEMIITADTLVILNDKVLGKPQNHEEAIKMLEELSGKIHKVITGVCITTKYKRVSFSSTTEVKFTKMSKSDIEYYVNSYRPYDKAGAYGIQEWIGCVAVEWINGSYYNVMGLPVHKLYEKIKEF